MAKKKITIPKYSLSEEIINSITHGLGAVLSIWGLVMLIIKASREGALAVTAVTIFGACSIILYSISCIYHALSKELKGKKVLRVIDHCNVFLLVYGTIIPVALLGIGGFRGWILFAIASTVTAFGITASSIALEKTQVFEVVCHLLNGWSVILYSEILLNNIGIMGIKLMIYGGIAYTLGAILYGLGSKNRYMHSIFHVFCLFGTMFHYFAIYLYIL